MLDAMDDSRNAVAADWAGSIRGATLADSGALVRLFRSAGLAFLPLGIADLSEMLDRGQLLVLDLGPGALGAAAYVRIDPRARGLHARLQFLVASPALTGTGVEDRMAAAALTICESSGCIDVDVMTEPAARAG